MVGPMSELSWPQVSALVGSVRRNFATELKDTPLKDLCALGGWKDHNTVLKCYQHADEAAMREALVKRREVEFEPQPTVQSTVRSTADPA